jgi:hypothetical protein
MIVNQCFWKILKYSTINYKKSIFLTHLILLEVLTLENYLISITSLQKVNIYLLS